MQVTLRRIEAHLNIRRWYFVSIQPALFDKIAVICGWGRLNGKYARWRVIPAGSQQQADEIAWNIIEKRLQHGYKIVGSANEIQIRDC